MTWATRGTLFLRADCFGRTERRVLVRLRLQCGITNGPQDTTRVDRYGRNQPGPEFGCGMCRGGWANLNSPISGFPA